MATPANTSTELRLAKIRQELINNNYDMGAYQIGETSLYQASIGTYGTINTANAAADRPNGTAPHSMSEFYNYDHDFSSSLHETTLTRGSAGGYGFAHSGYWDANFGSMGDDTLTYNSRAVTIYRLYTAAGSTSATTGSIILDIRDDLQTTSPPNSGWTTMSIYINQSNDGGGADYVFSRSQAVYTSYGNVGLAGARWTWSVSSSGTPTVFNKYWGTSDNTVNYVVLE